MNILGQSRHKFQTVYSPTAVHKIQFPKTEFPKMYLDEFLKYEMQQNDFYLPPPFNKLAPTDKKITYRTLSNWIILMNFNE